MERKQPIANSFDPGSIVDPVLVYEEIRAGGNVVWNDVLSGCVVIGNEEGPAVVADPGDRFAILAGDPELTFWFEAPEFIGGPECGGVDVGVHATT